MQVLKNAGAAVLGWIVMAVVVFAGHALAWVAMGVELSFQPDSWSPSTLWSAVSVAIGLGAAVLGGVVCAKTAPDRRTVWALAGLVFVLGVLAALLPEASVAEGPRPAAVSMMEAMNNAQSPRWYVWLNPLIGAAGPWSAAAWCTREGSPKLRDRPRDASLPGRRRHGAREPARMTLGARALRIATVLRVPTVLRACRASPVPTVTPACRASLVALVLLVATSGLAAPAEATAQTPAPANLQRPLELEDYYRLKAAGSPALSPDGTQVAYVVTIVVEDENRRRREVWLAPADGSGEPVRVTDPDDDASSPRWTSDGSLLSYSAAGEWHFVAIDAPAPDAPFQIEGLEGAPVFSPDGHWIAFTAPVPPPPAPEREYASDFERRTVERFDGRTYDWMNYRFDRRGYLPDPRDPAATPPREVHLIPATGGEARRLTELGVDARGLAWSPDARRIAFAADAHQRDEHSYERADLWVVGIDGVTDRLTDDEFNYSAPSWSPSGAQVVARGAEGLDVVIREGRNRGAPTDLFVFDAAGGTGSRSPAATRPPNPVATQPRNLTAQWDLIPGAPTWGSDGHVYFAAGIGGNAHLFRAPASGGPVEQVTHGDRRLSSFSYSADFSRVAYRATTPTRPGDVRVGTPISPLPAAGEPTTLPEVAVSDVNRELLAQLDLASPARLLFASPDGTEIEGWILPASGHRSATGPEAGRPSTEPGGFPLILQIHGGPHGAYGNDFSFDRQLLAAHGYMVLYVNPRASTGYGEDLRWATWGGWGFKDYEDVMAGVDHAIARYDIDTARMGVTGYSYGGFLTNWIVTQTDRFAAAAAGASISNWVSDYGVADIPRTKESEFFGPPWEARGLENLLRSSPIVHAKGVTTPTLFVHGESDHRVPIEEAEQMYVALKKQGVPARFVRYPDSYHGGWTPWRTVHRTWVQLEWWKQWLGGLIP